MSFDTTSRLDGPVPSEPPAYVRPKRRWKLPTAIGVGALLLGLALGSGGSSASPGAAAPTTVTTTATTTATTTETAAPQQVVPQACLDALDQADDLADISHDMASAVAGHLGNDGKVFTQISKMDFDVEWYTEKLDGFTDKIADLTARVRTNTYAADRAACRAAG